MSTHEVKVPRSATSIHVTALDGIINVNSLFTLAVFVGLAWNPTDRSFSLVDDPDCLASRSVAEGLVSFHVFSFASFLFSSVVAQGLKQAIRLSENHHASAAPHHRHHEAGGMLTHVNKTVLRAGMLICAVGSVSGCMFLMLALIDFVQVKLGSLSCRGFWTMSAVAPLVILIPAAIIIYICVVIHAFMR
ncbi:uncharacterized protein LOC116255601 [Nymphaea colorata]|uniref:uncharacterized protein LOC116255601 n=1 Tax=Nymphaea colorata TaxID=210225 RepID=UPI00129D6F7F|nr:uncharacterized protein LOC116255601 [Nymphaea colorata]